MVLGGSRNNYKVNEVSVFDTWSQGVDHRVMPEFYCEGIGNQSVQSFDGEVTALVKGPENESFLVSYQTRNADINVIQKIGDFVVEETRQGRKQIGLKNKSAKF